MADEIDTSKDGVSPNVRRIRWLARTEAILIARAQHTITQVVEMSEIVDAFATHSIFSAHLRELWDRGLLLRPMWVRLIQAFFFPSPRCSLLLTFRPPARSPPCPLSASPPCRHTCLLWLGKYAHGLHCNISRLPVRQCCA